MKPRTFSVGIHAVVVAMTLLVEAPMAMAIVAVERDFPDLVARAEQIVIGTVAEIGEGRDEGGGAVTYVTLDQLSVLKGDVGSTLVIRFYGGIEGDVVSRISDMPRFRLGERALLFVAGNGHDICPLVGIWQGRFRTRYDTERGLEVVEDHAGRAISGRDGRLLRRSNRSQRDSRPALSLDEFRQLVADELASPSH